MRKFFAFVSVASALVLSVYVFTNYVDVSLPNVSIPNEVEVEESKKAEPLVEKLNSEVLDQVRNVPDELAQELRSSRLYLMLRGGNQNVTKSYVFENGAFATDHSQGIVDYFYSFANDGSKLAFFAVPHETEAGSGGWAENAKLFVASSTEVASTSFPLLANSIVLDESTIKYKQHPMISNAGDVLFVGWDQSWEPVVENVDDWSIYAVVDGKAQFLTNGFMPKWLNDDEFIYLKNDGLYISNKDNSEVTQLYEAPSGKTIQNNNNFDISPNGEAIAWTQPDNGQVVLFTLTEDNELVEEATFKAKGFWVTFSPSGKYLAVQTISEYATGKEADPQAKIEFFDTATKMKIPELEIALSDFNQLFMFINDWVTR
jgi:hypothetical protein